jgi:hypothetical protein
MHIKNDFMATGLPYPNVLLPDFLVLLQLYLLVAKDIKRKSDYAHSIRLP